jgi:RNA polymerase sigma factor (sigma-70 family)
MEFEASGRGITAMAQAVTTSVIRQLESLFTSGSVAGLTDRQLIEQFVTGRDSLAAQAAFAAIVARHGPMVLGVCRQLLGDYQRAEDAFQAVFFVLARRARAIRDPDLLSNWLYGVALRTARKARTRLARMRQNEENRAVYRPEAAPTAPADRSAIEREQAEALHEEVDRLPESARLPVVLCYFEGLTLVQAARRLRCPAGTVRSRLDRAKHRLRRALLRRGIMLSGTAMAAVLSPRSASASIHPLLCDSTTRAAICFAARQAAGGTPAAALAQEVLKSMLIHKLRLAAISLLLVGSIATGAGYLASRAFAQTQEGKPPGEPIVQKARTAPRPADPTRPAPARMTVTGRVLRPDGQPAVGVPVDIIAAPRTPEAAIDVEPEIFVALGQGSTDADGRFRVEASRGSSTQFYTVYALSGPAGPGSAFGCVKFQTDAEQPAVEIHLPPDQVIRGKLVDVLGRPAARVKVELEGVYNDYPRPDDSRFDDPGFFARWRWTATLGHLRAWPKAVTTDAQGRFTFAGIGRGLHASLVIRDPRFAQQQFDFKPKERDATKEVVLALQPSTTIEGRILADDTGRPIPGAVIAVWAHFGRKGSTGMAKVRADDQGRFRVNPYTGDRFDLGFFPPEDQPYLSQEAEVDWPKGAIRKEIDFKLPRGVLIRGRVLEEGTGRPVAGASIQYYPAKPSRQDITEQLAAVTSKADGTYQLVVRPGKGHLMVVAPTLDYIPRETSHGVLFGSGQPRGRRYHAHAIVAYDVRAGEASHELDAILSPGKTLRGRMTGPAGETVDDAVILSRQQINSSQLSWEEYHFIHAHDGRFELTGFDPDQSTPVYVLDAEHGWGARVELSGKQAGDDLTVRLQPCGQAKVRFVGPDGKPVVIPRVYIYFQILMTPGFANAGAVVIGSASQGDSLAAELAFVANVDRKHHANNLATDADGRVTLAALIPGAQYRISDWSTVNVQGKGYQLRKEFTVKPGETLDLGNILVEKPETK